jgi:hypothetical protein
MDDEAHAQVEIFEVPKPDSTEMVKFLAARMDEMFNVMSEMFPFTAGDVMSACLCHMVEAGKIGRNGDMDALKGDLLQSVEVAIAHYSRPDRKDMQ